LKKGAVAKFRALRAKEVRQFLLKQWGRMDGAQMAEPAGNVFGIFTVPLVAFTILLPGFAVKSIATFAFVSHHAHERSDHDGRI
jgi:hypothetical protein